MMTDDASAWNTSRSASRLPHRLNSIVFAIATMLLLLVIHKPAVAETTTEEDIIIEKIIGQLEAWQKDHLSSSSPQRRPFVTVSFAQSLDGILAAFTTSSQHHHGGDKDTATTTTTTITTSSNYPLSGEAARRLTHAIRSIHDGILIGGRTLWIDNPQLTNRLWNVGSSNSQKQQQQQQQQQQPRPIVLDTHLNYLQRLGESCRAAQNNLIVCCSHEAASSLETLPACYDHAVILPCRVCDDDNGQLDLRHVLLELRTRYGIKTLMVEGGPTVLRSLLLLSSASSCFLRDDSDKNESSGNDEDMDALVGALCVTIAPKLLHAGLGTSMSSSTAAAAAVSPLDLTDASPCFYPLGTDCILLSQWSPKRG